jgi:hypothetical protein
LISINTIADPNPCKALDPNILLPAKGGETPLRHGQENKGTREQGKVYLIRLKRSELPRALMTLIKA